MVNNVLRRKEMIILTAIEIINDLGFHGVSTREIANRQKIAESTIYKHFKSKNDVMTAVLDYYSKFDKDIVISAKKQSSNPIEALFIFLKAYAEYYENYPAITSISISYMMLVNDPPFSDKVKDIIHYRERFVQEQINLAKSQNLIDANIDSEVLTDIFIGSFNRVCFKWRMSNGESSLKEKLLSNFQTLMKNFCL